MNTLAKFVLNKIVIRSLFASIVPITLYLIGLKLFDLGTSLDWFIIVACSVAWPFSDICLWMLFTPIDAFIKRKLWIHPSKNPWKEGNFAPVQHEDNYEILKVKSGKIPTDIQGVYFRNGPNA
jgi:hypothetical protein